MKQDSRSKAEARADDEARLRVEAAADAVRAMIPIAVLMLIGMAVVGAALMAASRGLGQ